MHKIKNKKGEIVAVVDENDFPLIIDSIFQDAGRKEQRTYKLYKGKKGTLNLGRDEPIGVMVTKRL